MADMPDDVGTDAWHLRVFGRPRKQYTDSQPAFSLFREQRAEIDEWVTKHDLTHVEPGESRRKTGAIGGAYTWCFTPTSIGVVVKVRCACGEQIDVSDYDSW